MWLRKLALIGCFQVVMATRTVPASTVVTVRDQVHYETLRRTAPLHAIFFFDPSCSRCAQQAGMFTQESRNLIERDVLPMRIDATNPAFSDLRRRFKIGGAPKFVFRNETGEKHLTHRFRKREGVTLKKWLDALGEPSETRQWLNSQNPQQRKRKTHVILFLNPHGKSEHQHILLRAFRRALATAPSTIHHYYTHFDGEHHHLLNEFGLLQHTGHPDYHNDRIVFACREDQGQIIRHQSFEGIPHERIGETLALMWDFCNSHPKADPNSEEPA